MKPQEALDLLKLKTRWLDTSIFNVQGCKPSMDQANNLHRLAEHVMNAAKAYQDAVREVILGAAQPQTPGTAPTPSAAPPAPVRKDDPHRG